MAGEGEEEIPPRYWYEFLDRFSRRDELLVAVLKDIRKLLGKVVEVPAVEVPEVEFEVPELTAPQLKLIDTMAMRLQQLPNRLHKADIDTSQTSWRSLKGAGKLKGDVMQGFYIEAVGEVSVTRLYGVHGRHRRWMRKWMTVGISSLTIWLCWALEQREQPPCGIGGELHPA